MYSYRIKGKKTSSFKKNIKLTLNRKNELLINLLINRPINHSIYLFT